MQLPSKTFRQRITSLTVDLLIKSLQRYQPNLAARLRLAQSLRKAALGKDIVMTGCTFPEYRCLIPQQIILTHFLEYQSHAVGKILLYRVRIGLCNPAGIDRTHVDRHQQVYAHPGKKAEREKQRIRNITSIGPALSIYFARLSSKCTRFCNLYVLYSIHQKEITSL